MSASTATLRQVDGNIAPRVAESRHGPFKADSGDSADISPMQVRAMLREWARWVTWPEPMGPAPASCRSAEHNYRSPQCWDERLPRPIEPDWRIAWKVEAIIRTMPRLDAKVVRVWYVVLGPRVRHGHTSVDPYELAARRAHVGSASRYAELLSHAENDLRMKLSMMT